VVVTGFEPVDLLGGVLAAVRQLERGEARVENQYARVVQEAGNREALRMIEDVFVVGDRTWRGLGEIPMSGYELASAYARFDASRVFGAGGEPAKEPPECRSGLVLQGRLKPPQCPEFGTRCTPEHPLGATMVSADGACAAYFQYRRTREEAVTAAG
jgi:hydrogenase expression/formation protein HypD